MKRLAWVLVLAFGAAAQDAETLRTVGLVAAITGQIGEGPVFGAGIVFAREKDRLYIVTANHVVRRGGTEARNIQVRLRNWPGKPLTAKLLPQMERELDVAVLTVEQLGANGVDPCALSLDRLAPPGTATRGVAAFAVGNPNGVPWMVPVGRDPIREEQDNQVMFESARIARGHSGGALIGPGGQVIGMIQADEPPNGRALSMTRVIEILRSWTLPVQLRVPASGGLSPLAEAARTNNLEDAKLLLAQACTNVNQGADLKAGFPVLAMAASYSGVAMVNLFLEAGAAVNPGTGPRRTPLEDAAEAGSLAVVATLLAHGAEVNIRNPYGGSALIAAATRGRGEVVKLLLASGADPNLAGDRADPPLSAAARSGGDGPTNGEMLRALLQAGANVNWKDRSGYSALTRAVQRKDVGAVKILLVGGADAAFRDGNGFSLFSLLNGSLPWQDERIHQIDIEMLKSVSNIESSDGALLLNASAWGGWEEVAALLIQRGFNVKGEAGKKALGDAAERGHLKVMQALLEAGVDPEAAGEQYTPLERALSEDRGGIKLMEPAVRLEVVRLLVSKGAKVNIKVESYYRQLIWRAVIDLKDLNIAQFLMAHGAIVPDYMIVGARNLPRPDAVAWFLKARSAPPLKK